MREREEERERQYVLKAKRATKHNRLESRLHHTPLSVLLPRPHCRVLPTRKRNICRLVAVLYGDAELRGACTSLKTKLCERNEVYRLVDTL